MSDRGGQSATIWGAVAIAIFGLACSPGASGPPPPNIVLIISDDQGFTDYGFMGSRHLRTPSLDRLAAEGVVFTHGFSTSSVCRPALQSLLSGLQPLQWAAKREALTEDGVDFGRMREVRHIETLPRLLATRGYRSFQAGKYWEGSPEDGGFTAGMKDSGEADGANRIHNLAGGERSLGLIRESLDPVFEFLGEKPDEPFFLWFAPMLPHRPHDAPEAFRKPYERMRLSDQTRRYYATITWMDDGIAQLLAKLDEMGVRDNTLVVFLADNGRQQPPTGHVSKAGDTHGKGSIYEFGFRTPIVFNFPDHIPPGLRSDGLVSSVDVFTTILDFAGIEAPAPRDGASLRRALEVGAAFDRSQIIGGSEALTRLPPGIADDESNTGPEWLAEIAGSAGAQAAYFLRTKEWRYVWFPESDLEELYAIDSDPMERHDVASFYPELSAKFQGEIKAWIEAQRAAYAAR